MYGREKELEDLQSFVGSMSAFPLLAAHNPIPAFFCVFERVDAAREGIDALDVKDNFYAIGGLAPASMHDSGVHTVLKNPIIFVQDGVDFIVHSIE